MMRFGTRASLRIDSMGRRKMGIKRSGLAASIAATAVAVCLTLTSPAMAAFGDSFDIADVNVAGAQSSAAYPGAKVWWAGACDLASSTTDVGVASPVRRDCIDWGAPNTACGLLSGCDPVATATGHVWRPGFEPAWRLMGADQAGGRPDGSATFALERNGPNDGGANDPITPDGSADNILVDLPAGFVGNPRALPKCSAHQFSTEPVQCPPETQIGVSTILLSTSATPGFNHATYPVYNLESRSGYTAEFGIPDVGDQGFTSVRIVARARTHSDYGVSAGVTQIPAALALWQQAVTLWAVPWAASNDRWRMPQGALTGNPSCVGGTVGASIPPTGLSPACQRQYSPTWGPIRPFFANITGPAKAGEACDGTGSQPNTRLNIDTFQRPGAFDESGFPTGVGQPGSNWITADSPAPALKGCHLVGFNPDFDLTPTVRASDSASGLDVDLAIPQNNDPPASVAHNPDDATGAPAYWKSPLGHAQSHLKDSVVKLPAGFSVNLAAATGLQGCSDAQIGLRDATTNPPRFNNGDPFDNAGPVECPSGSQIGTAEVSTPLLEEKLIGRVVLGEPQSTDPQSGRMFRMFIVVSAPERDLIAKIYGSAVADPATGQLTATFENNPQVPFDKLDLSFKGGGKGILATPRTCGGSNAWTSSLSPWSGNAAVGDGGQFPVDQGCGGGFAPNLDSGMSTRAARSHGTFSFRFGRQPGEQYLRGLTTTLPKGLLASVKGLIGSNLCSNAQAGAGTCPASSKIGIVDAKAGAGDPFVLEEKGEVFLTEGYKGGEYGLLVKVRGVGGPFRGAMELSPVLVRQALYVDRDTAQVTAVSDPFPLIHHGVPLRVREITVLVNRPSFMLNPSDCSAKRIAATFVSEQGAGATSSSPFQASGCSRLPFKPRLALRLTGRKQIRTGKHPGVRAVVRQKGVGEAGIEKAVVRLPKSLALDPDNAQALCEFADGTKPDIEKRCPKGSIVGRARATSPLLNKPLVGNTYFVKNVRTDRRTGNQIRTLPMIIVALRGEISINLRGESSTTKAGRLVNTFAGVPDAPVSKFNLNLKGGKRGILAVTQTRRGRINLCSKPKSHVADADMDGHNGKRFDRNVRMKTPCSKKAKNRAAKGKRKGRNKKQ